MILYHGSNVEVEFPKLFKPKKRNDFGNAFYLTPYKDSAERMARRKVKIASTGKPIVSIFEWNEKITNLKIKRFKTPSKDWLEMIIKCRNNINYKHGFDIVEGKIADDKVGLIINQVLFGGLREDDAIDQLKFKQINSQLAFCSDKALKGLSFVKSYEVKL